MNEDAARPPRAPGDLPRWAVRLLQRLAPLHNRDVVLGDFAEVYRILVGREGRGKAQRWYWGQVLKSTPAFIANGIYFGGDMVRNYLKIALRSMSRRKFYAALNVGGLAIGMAACLLIFQYVAFEQSYDTFHTNRDHLYRTTHTSIQNGVVEDTDVFTWSAMGAVLAETVPEMRRYARVHPNYGTATLAYVDPSGERKAFREEGLLFVDPAFLSMFSFSVAQGDPETALAAPRTIVLTASAARKYFGDDDPLGQTLEVRAWTDGTYTVTGVLHDIPQNSHLRFDFLVPLDDLLQDEHAQYAGTDGWNWTNFVTYVELHPDADVAAVEGKFTEVVSEQMRERLAASSSALRLGLQPLEAIHLYSDFDQDAAVIGSYRTVYLFTLVALFILLIAWVNYVNLSTARAVERAKEVGVRKVAGARKAQVVKQFLFESVLINVVTFGLAVVLAVFGLPYLNDLAGTAISGTIWRDPWFWSRFLAVFVVGVSLSSLYPALVLSAFKPVVVLKGRLGSAASRTTLRKVLVVFQFAASIALLTGTYAAYQQVGYMRGVDLGIDLDQMLVVNRPNLIEDGVDFAEVREVFKAELAKHPALSPVTTSTNVPGSGFSYSGPFRRESAPASDEAMVRIAWIHYNFVDVYGLDVVAGRTFSEAIATDLEDRILLNETAVRTLGFETNEAAVGQTVIIGGGSAFHVIGVLKDFHWMSVKQAVESYAFSLTRGGRFYSMKVQTTDLDETLVAVQAVYDEVFPGNPFDYFFVDRFFDEQYKADRQFGTLFGIFALFAVFVACLGLVGLAAITAAQRTKEIGVRKVLGASAGTIVRLLLLDFGKLVLAALVLTLPFTYFALDAWLADFVARIDLTVWLFLVPGLVVMTLALLTVSYHTTRAAFTNPADSLRYE